MKDKKIAVKLRDGKKIEEFTVDKFVQKLKKEIEDKN